MCLCCITRCMCLHACMSACVCLSVCLCMWDSERARERHWDKETDGDRDRHRQIYRERDRDSNGKREGERERESASKLYCNFVYWICACAYIHRSILSNTKDVNFNSTHSSLIILYLHHEGLAQAKALCQHCFDPCCDWCLLSWWGKSSVVLVVAASVFFSQVMWCDSQHRCHHHHYHASYWILLLDLETIYFFVAPFFPFKICLIQFAYPLSSASATPIHIVWYTVTHTHVHTHMYTHTHAHTHTLSLSLPSFIALQVTCTQKCTQYTLSSVGS